MSWISCCKQYVVLLCALCVFFMAKSASAVDVDQCDYDNVQWGSAEVMEKDGKLMIMQSNAGGHGFAASVEPGAPIIAMVEAAMKDAIVDDTGEKSIAMLMRLNTPICAVAYREQKLFVQELVEKDTYYAVNVCLPESGSCWYKKINKNSYLAARMRLEDIKDYVGKVHTIVDDGTENLLDMYIMNED